MSIWYRIWVQNGFNSFLFIYTEIKPAYPLYPMDVGMGITLQYSIGMSIGMGMGMSINFENGYG